MRLNLGIIFGGRSVEHEISIITALQCIESIDQERFHIIPIYLAKNGKWYSGPELFDLNNFRNLDWLTSKSREVVVNQSVGASELWLMPKHFFQSKKVLKVDLLFPITHGTFGEDGTLQGLFETMNVPYVGCNPLASAISMDKVATKYLLAALGVKALDYFWFYNNQWFEDKTEVLNRIKDKLAYPLIVKPVTLGSSIGVSVANDDLRLEQAIDLAARLSGKILIEPKINNLKEINCAVLGDNYEVEVSVCEEPLATGDILSYQDKYGSGGFDKAGGVKKFKGLKNAGANKLQGAMSDASRKIPADITKQLSDHIREIAKKVFIGLGCSGVVRFDFLLDQDSNELYLCEMNAIPGSLAFYLWEATGKKYPELLESLFNLAMKKHRETNNLITSYDKNILKTWG